MQDEIKHVVIVMLENRSFDNVFGQLYDENTQPSKYIPANPDIPFLGLSDDIVNQYTNVLKNSNGDIIFSCSPIKGVPSLNDTKYLNSPKFDPNEAFPNVQNQIFGTGGGTNPAMLGFLQDYASLWNEDDWLSYQADICAVMESYTDKEIPFMHNLARHYAISDYWFSSVPTQTNPNRAFTFCGTSLGEIVNGFLGKNNFETDTMWNRISEESPNSTWTVFWQSDMLPVIYPGPFSGPNNFPNMKKIPNVDDHYKTMDYFHELARAGQLPDVSFVEPQWTLSLNVSPKEKEILTALMNDDEIVVGYQGNDLHPPGDIRTGENFIANIYTSLISNQEAWKQTLLIITFDEHGGIFDHISPPAAVPPDNYNQNGFNFDRFGVRVPVIFVSPLIEKGTIIRSDNPLTPFDHTSLIATILKWQKIDKSKWNLGARVDAAPTFENVITLSEPREDCIVCNDSLASIENGDVINFDEPFCIRDENGNYLCRSYPEFFHLAPAGSAKDKVSLKFTCGCGTLTHGSFMLIQSLDVNMSDDNLLESRMRVIDCGFASNTHTACQWWTIKKADENSLGSQICYGDRVYIENHVYQDLFQLVPGRLSVTDGLFGKHLTTKPVTEKNSENNYWIIERP